MISPGLNIDALRRGSGEGEKEDCHEPGSETIPRGIETDLDQRWQWQCIAITCIYVYLRSRVIKRAIHISTVTTAPLGLGVISWSYRDGLEDNR